MDLAGVATLVIDKPENAHFHFEPLQNRWEFLITAPSNESIGQVFGLTPLTEQLKLQAFSVNSQSKYAHIQLANSSKSIGVYNNLASYQLNTFDVSPDAKQLSLNGGLIDLHIPGLNAVQNNSLLFEKVGGVVQVKILPMKLSGFLKGVNMLFNLPADALQENGISCSGKLWENLNQTTQEMYHLDVKINHTVNQSTISIDPLGNRTLYIDKEHTRSFSNLTGAMNTIANNTDWTYFKFSGALSGTPDLSGELAFTIKGEILMDPNQKNIKVKSMNDSGTGISQGEFDFTTGAFYAKLTIPTESLGGGVTFGGNAGLAINTNGWYFAGSGVLGFPNPFIDKANCAILMGNYSKATTDNGIVDVFAGSKFYQIKHQIPGLLSNSLNGIVVDAVVSKSVLDHAEMNWGPVAKLRLNCDVFADTYFAADFSSSKTIAVGGMLGAEGNLEADLNGMVACVYGSADATVDGYVKGAITSNGNYCLSVGGDVSIKGELGIAAGECVWPNSCNSVACPSVLAIGTGIGAGAEYTVGNAGCDTGLKLYLK